MRKKTRFLLALVLVAAGCAVWAEAPPPKSKELASLQACDAAMRDLEVSRRTSESAAADAEKRVLKACYTGSGRAPVLQAPISVYNDPKAAKPVVPVLPAPQVLAPPSAPSVITACDAGGCWDNLGKRYNGIGTTLFGNTGAPCIRTGNQIECH